MIEFFNKQHSTNIRSRPEDVNDALAACGENKLKDSQIKGFWSSHSQKRKRLMQSIEQQISGLNAE